MRQGGCLCGAVRYEALWPPLALVTCHCTHCQKQAGSALSVVGVVRRDALHLTGELSTYRDEGASGQPVYRKFCGRCGSPLFSRTTAKPGVVRLRAGTLDDPSGARLGFHIFADSHADWWALDDELPRFSERAPD